MKTTSTFYGLTAILLAVLATLVSAQDDKEVAQKARETQRAMMRSPAMQKMQKNAMKQGLSSFWNGEGSYLMAIGLLQQDDFREGLGISKEQQQKIQDSMQISSHMHEDPAFKTIFEEINKLSMENGGPFAENASEETQKKFFDLQGQMQNILFERIISNVKENLTPDQMKKVQEFQISTMSEMPIVSPGMFEALDLSDEQKKQLGEIKKEMEPEFEKHLDKMADAQWKFSEKFQEELEGKLDDVTDPEERTRIIKEIAEKVQKSDPEFQRENEEILESGKGLANQLKFRMFDVLTDEQMERMAYLIDNPPDFVKKAIAKIRKEMGHDDDSASGEWKPNANSWKPGDGIPEGYMEHREEQKKRFPSRRQ
jgi:hypothetical protein